MAKTQQKQPPSYMLVKEEPASSEELTLQEALSVLTYLNGRGNMCSKCGFRLATLSNQNSQVCTDCSIASMTYNTHRKASLVEQFLCGRIGQWVNRVVLTSEWGGSTVTDSSTGGGK